MKNFGFVPIVLVTLFLTACPAAEPPVEPVDPIPVDPPPVTDISGTWSGLIGDLESDNKSLFTVEFEQMEAELSGTATFGPAVYGFSSELSGQVDDDDVTFTFTLESEVDDNGEITTFETVYTLTGTLEENRMSGEVVAQTEGLGTETGEFELER